jgi:hypothetical protein
MKPANNKIPVKVIVYFSKNVQRYLTN